MSTPPTTPQWAEEMLAACIPGGDVCDPQMVADHLRDWLTKHAPSPAAQPSDAVTPESIAKIRDELRRQIAIDCGKFAAPPTDEAKLREKLRALCSSARDTAVCLVDAQKGPNNVMRVEGPQRLKDKLNEIMELLPHAAPHLAQREPGDSELLDWLDKTEHDLVFECGDPDVGAFSAWQVWRNAKWQDGRPLMVAFDGSLRAAIKAAMRGEGKP